MINLRRIGLMFAGGVLIASAVTRSAVAAKYWTPDTNNCNQQQTTIDIAVCLEGRTKIWDARLNEAYKALMAMLDSETDTVQIADLKKAQRLWIQYRNANCAYYDDGPGTIREIEGAGCLLRMTQDRAIELQQAGPEP
jgi:uncharacterized protein YecT (DUF1311 family)